MRAELLKLRALPTPRWTAIVCLGMLTAALVIAWFAGVGDPSDNAVLGLGAELPTAVGAIVLGAWIVGVEFGQCTMRRTLTADPRRVRVALTKLATAVMATIALTVIAFIVALVALPLIASAQDKDFPVSDVLTVLAIALVSNGLGAMFGFSIVLLTRSFAAGLTVALVFGFVVDTALTAIPDVGDYTIGGSLVQISDAIRGREVEGSLAQAIPTLMAWYAVLVGAGIMRFARSDV